MRIFLKILIPLLAALLGFQAGSMLKKITYNERCIKYFGYKGYPADGYCKLFVGEIKARDE